MNRATGLLLLCIGCVWASPAQAEADFGKDILPILKEHCFSCHDGRKQTSALRLDLRSRAFKAGESGEPALVAGKPDQSAVLQRIESTDADLRMPPAAPLPAEQIRLIREWITAGAHWPDELAGKDADPSTHWAFQKVVRPELPTDSSGWSITPIDRFVIARLHQEQLQPSPPADKATLARRLSLDLIGLPPTPEELDQFLNDTRPDAYEQLVERLLASPHYGERWGRIWLDAARYADSDGFEKDKPRSVWFYRDWVIRALNSDMPYDQFVTEQLAGDLIPNATQDQQVATGFLRNSMLNEEGGVDPEQFRMEAMFDRMDAFGKAILGLTVQCAQCHDHKYDPISHVDYYRLFAFLNNSAEGSQAVYTAEQLQQRAMILGEIATLESQLQEMSPDWAARMAEWERTLPPEPTWTTLTPEIDTSGGQKQKLLDDGSILVQGYATTKSTTSLPVNPQGLQQIKAFRIELLNDPNLPMTGPGRSLEGTCALTEFTVDVHIPGAEKARRLKFDAAWSDANPDERPLAARFDDKSGKLRVTGPVSMAIDNNQLTAWGIDLGGGRTNVPRTAIFSLNEPLSLPEGSRLTIHLVQNHGGWNSDDNQTNNLGRYRLSVTQDMPHTPLMLPTSVRPVLAIPAPERSAGQQAALFSAWRTTVPEWAETNARIEKLWTSHPVPESQLVLKELEQPRSTHLLKRGDFLKPSQTVSPGVPGFLKPPQGNEPSSRLELARWLTSPECPTTARSIVNRIWQGHFGSGLVSTSEDLGMQSSPPSHPELLEWLSAELMQPSESPAGVQSAAWSLKHIHRLIVLSATYRQSSKVSEKLASLDPYNLLLARGARFRVDAEVVRDISLTASGLLNREMGGPSVHPPLPAFMLLPPVSYGPKTWTEDTGPNRYRRAVYTFRYRSIPYPSLQVFDAPNGDFSCVQRSRSNTPLQALVTLNEPVFLECARALARSIMICPGDDETLMNSAFRRCTGRLPEARERSILLDLLASERERLSQSEAQAWAAVSESSDKRPELPPGVTAAQLAAWTTVSRVLLNLDETITRE